MKLLGNRSLRVFSVWVLVSHVGALTPIALAGPEGGTVAAGTATIGQAGGVTSVTQLTDKVVVNWSGFSTASGESVRFVQPSAASVALNRVTGPSASVLNGSLDANGRIFLLNPNGVVFGRGSSVNTGGLVASTLSMNDADFLSGRYRLKQDATRPLGAVVNQGTIRTANGGRVALVAPAVVNEGTITAPGGQVALAAGQDAVVSLDGAGLVNLAVTTGPRGTVEMEKGAASVALSSVVNNRNLVDAGTASESGGVVTLGAAEGIALNTGSINVDAAAGQASAGAVRIHGTQASFVSGQGSVSARGDGAGQHGGRVEVLGDRVGLLDSARVDASGRAGGGKIYLGGARSGGPGLPRAKATFVGAEAEVVADGIESGAGGEIIAFGEQVTRVGSVLKARGGTVRGDGGFVETSGATLSLPKAPDVRALSRYAANTNNSGSAVGNANTNASRNGTWLIDPGDIAIIPGSGGGGVSGPPNFTAVAEGATIGADTVITALSNGNVMVKGTASTNNNGNVNIAGALNVNSSGSTLTIEADHNISFTNSFGPSAPTMGAGLILRSNLGGSGGGVAISQTIDTNGFDFMSSGASFVLSAGGVSTVTGQSRVGDISILHSGNVVMNGGSVIGNGGLTIQGVDLLIGTSVGVQGDVNAQMLGNIAVSGGGSLSGGTVTLAAGGTGALSNISSNDVMKINVGGLPSGVGLRLDNISGAGFKDIELVDGDIALGLVNALGGVKLVARGGSIQDDNLSAVNVTGSSMSFAAEGTVGTVASPIDVSGVGNIAVQAGAAPGGVSGVLTGSLSGGQVIEVNGTAGQVLFNGAEAPVKRTVLSLAFVDPELAVSVYGNAGMLAVQAIANQDKALARSLIRAQPGPNTNFTPQAAGSVSGLELAELNAIFGSPALPPPPVAAPTPVTAVPPVAPPAPAIVPLATTPQPTPVPMAGTGSFTVPGAGLGALGGRALVAGSFGYGVPSGLVGGGFGSLAGAGLGGTAPVAPVYGVSSFGSASTPGLSGFASLEGAGTGVSSFPFGFAGFGSPFAGGTGFFGGASGFGGSGLMGGTSAFYGGTSPSYGGTAGSGFTGLNSGGYGGAISGSTVIGGTAPFTGFNTFGGGLANQLTLGGTPVIR